MIVLKIDPNSFFFLIFYSVTSFSILGVEGKFFLCQRSNLIFFDCQGIGIGVLYVGIL